MKIPVRIASIRQKTPTVKSYTLSLEGQEFTFYGNGKAPEVGDSDKLIKLTCTAAQTCEVSVVFGEATPS